MQFLQFKDDQGTTSFNTSNLKELEEKYTTKRYNSCPFFMVNRHPTRVIRAIRFAMNGQIYGWYALNPPVPRTCASSLVADCVTNQYWKFICYLVTETQFVMQYAAQETDGQWYIALAQNVFIPNGTPLVYSAYPF